MNPDSQAEYDYHPLANRFPLIEGTEFQDLVADVRANGLFEEIVLHEGKVLDGRNRYRACIEAGVEPRFLQFDASWGDPWAFILSRNAHRRHLTPEQRRQVVLGAVAAGETHAEAAKRAGTTCLIPRSVDSDPFDGARRPAGQARAIKWVTINAPWYNLAVVCAGCAEG